MLSKRKITVYLMMFAVATALLSQYPDINKSVVSLINYGAWGLLLVNMFFTERYIFFNKYFKEVLLLIGGFIVLQILLILLGLSKSLSQYIALFPIPLVVYYTSFRIGNRNINEKNINKLILIYVIMGVIMSLLIFTQARGNFSVWMDTEMYMYKGSTHKNSTGQVLACTLIILLFYYKPKNIIYKFIQIMSLGIIIVSLFYIQSRSTIISIGVVIVLASLLQNENKKKILMILAIVGIVLLAINSEFIMNVLNRAFFIDKYSKGGSLDMNKFSSGRLDFWSDSYKRFVSNPLFGTGAGYCDNFYIMVLSNGGLIGGGLLIFLYFKRVLVNFKRYKLSDRNINLREEKFIAILVSIYYLCTSFFEGFPPFGPGVACMFFWLISGYLDGYEYYNEPYNYEKSMNLREIRK